MNETAENTDEELFRLVPGDYYSPSLHVTISNGIGINVGGRVYVRSIYKWHELARAEESRESSPNIRKPSLIRRILQMLRLA